MRSLNLQKYKPIERISALPFKAGQINKIKVHCYNNYLFFPFQMALAEAFLMFQMWLIDQLYINWDCGMLNLSNSIKLGQA